MPGKISLEQLPKGLWSRLGLRRSRARRVPQMSEVDVAGKNTAGPNTQIYKRCKKGCTVVLNGPDRCDVCSSVMR